MTKLFCYSLLSLSISNALADELGTINVIDTPESIQNKKVGETFKTARFETEDLAKNTPEEAIRHTNDSSTRKNVAFAYENYNSNFLWDSLKFTVNKQKINQRAQTDDYCEGGTSCDAYYNPAGLHLQENENYTEIVDKYGKPVQWKRFTLIDSKGKSYEGMESYNPKTLNEASGPSWAGKTLSNNQFYFDCSEINCNKPLKVLEHKNKDIWKIVNLDKKYTDPKTGKTYAGTQEEGSILKPTHGPGYLRREEWKDRSLITKTTKFTLDLSKYIETENMEHNINYGLNYAKSRKSMVNYFGMGLFANQPKLEYWVNRSNGGIEGYRKGKNDNAEKYCNPNSDEYACPYEDNTQAESFMVPVIINNASFYLNDNVRVNDWLAFDVGYRYDRIKYKSDYKEGVIQKFMMA